jgi:hypothetical protein
LKLESNFLKQRWSHVNEENQGGFSFRNFHLCDFQIKSLSVEKVFLTIESEQPGGGLGGGLALQFEIIILKCGGRLNYIVRAGYHSLDSAE